MRDVGHICVDASPSAFTMKFNNGARNVDHICVDVSLLRIPNAIGSNSLAIGHSALLEGIWDRSQRPKAKEKNAEKEGPRDGLKEQAFGHFETRGAEIFGGAVLIQTIWLTVFAAPIKTSVQ